MIRGYIERQERVHHGRDTNRVALPFAWGLEHVGLEQLSHSTSPAAALAEYANRALQDSDAFYSYTPPSHYEFDGHILKFPSFIETPYPENNTVVGRFFDGGKEMAAVVLPQWNCTWDGQAGLCQMMQRSGISALRLSLPYHHARKPAEIDRSEYLISPNVGRTLMATRQAVIDARGAADWLFAQGHRKVAIVGTSIGSCIAFLAFAHDERFSSGVFIHVSAYFADVVWAGLSTSHVRQSLEGAVDLPSLRRLWEPISPFPFIRRLHKSGRPLLSLSGRYDLTFLPELTRQAHDEFRRYDIDARTLWFPCGHYTMGKIPFNAVAGYRIQRFLAEQRGRKTEISANVVL